MQRPNVDDSLTLLTDFGKTEAIVIEVLDNPATEEGVLLKVMTRGVHFGDDNSRRNSSGAFSFTIILVSKSSPAEKPRYSWVGRA